MTQRRQSKGIPIGGQFAPDVNPESTLVLDAPGPTRHEVEVDTAIAAAYERALRANHYVERAADSVHYLLPNSELGYGSRRGRAHVIDVEAIRTRWLAGDVGAKLDNKWGREDQAKTFTRYDEALASFRVADDLYHSECRHYEGWSRFFLVQGGHIHSSLNCSTCNKEGKSTDFGWLPDLSGLTEEDAVKEHGAILCTVCYPSAPVEHTNKYELEKVAKAEKRCLGSGKYPGMKEGRRSNRCPDCGTRVTFTSNGYVRAHNKQTG